MSRPFAQIAPRVPIGRLKWHYQFTPHDENDWDSAQVPVLTTIEWQGQPRKVILWANRNGIMYVLDRINGQFLLGKPFVTVNWMNGFDEHGRPQRVAKKVVDAANPVLPYVATGTFQAGVLTTASDLLFTGVVGDQSVNGYFYALSARTGQMLWKTSLAGPVRGSPITYAVNGKQFVAISAVTLFLRSH